MKEHMLQELERIVRCAGDMVREAHDIEQVTTEKNGAADLVTKYDVAVQGFLKCQVAAGRVELFYECRLSPWDYAAGSLIVTEAGGTVTTLADTPLDVLHPSSVFAANAKCRGVLKELAL